MERVPASLVVPWFLRKVLVFSKGASGLRLSWVVACEDDFCVPSDEGNPLRLRLAVRGMLFRIEVASWLADETLLETWTPAGTSQASLRPSSHGWTEDDIVRYAQQRDIGTVLFRLKCAFCVFESDCLNPTAYSSRRVTDD